MLIAHAFILVSVCLANQNQRCGTAMHAPILHANFRATHLETFVRQGLEVPAVPGVLVVAFPRDADEVQRDRLEPRGDDSGQR
jgi:hypothetical protein